ncbi:hypothetical protein HanRHA438_Chr00c51g0859011 [Helianthus annuus]|nr:hypothetical protein HanRHA438_Chr00c51g0859011 [Helianthus annuus]
MITTVSLFATYRQNTLNMTCSDYTILYVCALGLYVDVLPLFEAQNRYIF